MFLLGQVEFWGHLLRGLAFTALLIYSLRDLIRGENGVTLGLVWLAAGVVVTSGFSLFETLTNHGDSWQTITRTGIAGGVWIMNIGAYFVIRAIKNTKVN